MEKEREIFLYTGKKVNLTTEEMQVISTIYRSIIEAEYIAENYFVTEEQANKIAGAVVEGISEYVTGEDENDIIQSILKESGYLSVPVAERNDCCYGDYPTLDEIKRDYEEFMSMVGEVATLKQLKEWKNKFIIEVNNEDLDAFLEYHFTEDITSILYEAYGCLSNIYVSIENGKVKNIVFDVWSNKEEESPEKLSGNFIEETSIDKIEEDYERYFNPVPVSEKTKEKTKVLSEQEAYELLDLLNKIGIEATKNESSISLADGRVNIPILNAKNLFVPGDIVMVKYPGKCYSTYHGFFGRYEISQDIACRYKDGASLSTAKPALYKVLAVHPHDEDKDISIAVIERIEDKKVYLIETVGIENAVVEVVNPNMVYSTYNTFFTHHHISEDIAERYMYDKSLYELYNKAPHTKFRVLGVYPHHNANEHNAHENVAIIENVDNGAVYLIDPNGLRIV